MNVPVVTTTVCERNLMPDCSSTPRSCTLFKVQCSDFALFKVKIVLLFKNPLHSKPVELLVGLGTRCSNGRSLFSVQNAKLDAGSVYILRHLAAQSINFLDQMPLCQTTYRGVTGHQGNRIQIDRQQHRTAPHTGRRQSGFAPCVSGADNNYIVYLFIGHHECGLQTRICFT